MVVASFLSPLFLVALVSLTIMFKNIVGIELKLVSKGNNRQKLRKRLVDIGKENLWNIFFSF